MHGTCFERCRNNLVYPIGDVTFKLPKLWELKGFIHCRNCNIYVSRSIYLKEIRCRCCNSKYKLKPRNTRKRRTLTGEKTILDKSNRFCLECRSLTTYIAMSSTGNPNHKWYKVEGGGFICNNCYSRRRWAIKQQQKNQIQTPIKLLVYNHI